MQVGCGAAKLTNFGTIRDGAGIGVVLGGGGTITNGSATDTTAVISSTGSDAIQAYSTEVQTIINFGTISSTGGRAVAFHAADRLIVEKSAVFVGALVGYRDAPAAAERWNWPGDRTPSLASAAPAR